MLATRSLRFATSLCLLTLSLEGLVKKAQFEAPVDKGATIKVPVRVQ
jgi:hypothetical protein